ncbi:MAG: helix-turn-helix transcriptional regulator [Clostridia bacterium]|nr:helix-turn-helix transcriptional regulator [Clostridia bacterium]
MKVFGERIKELRKEHNLSQEEFGRIFTNKIAQSTIGTWEKGLREPPFRAIIEMAKYFNVSIDYLFGIEEEKSSVSIYKTENCKKSNDIIEFLETDNVEYNNLKLRKNEKEMIKRILQAIFYENE